MIGFVGRTHSQGGKGNPKKPFRVGARLCAVETACAMLDYEGQRPFAYWWSVLGQNPVKKRGPWVDANLRVVTLLWQ
jgi:hypothetical protein